MNWFLAVSRGVADGPAMSRNACSFLDRNASASAVRWSVTACSATRVASYLFAMRNLTSVGEAVCLWSEIRSAVRSGRDMPPVL